MKKQIVWQEATTYQHWLENIADGLQDYEDENRYKSANRLAIAHKLRSILNDYRETDPKFAAKMINHYLEDHPIEKWGFWGPLKEFIENRLFNGKKLFNRNQKSYMHQFRKKALATFDDSLFQKNQQKLDDLKNAQRNIQEQESIAALKEQLFTLQERIKELEKEKLELKKEEQTAQAALKLADERHLQFKLDDELLTSNHKIQELQATKNLQQEKIGELTTQIEDLTNNLKTATTEIAKNSQFLRLLENTNKENSELNSERKTLHMTVQQQSEEYQALEKKYKTMENNLQEQIKKLQERNEGYITQQKQREDEIVLKLNGVETKLVTALKENNELKDKLVEYPTMKNKIEALQAAKSTLEEDKRQLGGILFHLKLIFVKYFSTEKVVYEVKPTPIELTTIKNLLNTEFEPSENNFSANSTIWKEIKSKTKLVFSNIKEKVENIEPQKRF